MEDRIMGQTVYRTKKDADSYVVWSSNVDAAVFYGTRQEVEEFLIEQEMERIREMIRLTMDQAERKGTSSPWMTDNNLTVMEGPGGPGLLLREDLHEYVMLLKANRVDQAAKLVRSRQPA